MFVRSFRRLVPLFTEEEGAEQQDDDANANRRVADIKDIKGPERPKMQIEEVDDIAKLHPIDGISKRAAEDHGQSELVAALLFLANPPGDADRDRGGHRDQEPAMGVVLRLGEAEADPMIMDPGEIEDRKQLDLLAFDVEAERAGDEPFAELVEGEDQQGEAVGEGA